MRSRIPHDPQPHPHPRTGWRRTVAAACSAVLITAGLAACGSAGAPAGPAVVTACAPSGLKVTVDASEAGTAAGSTYYPIDFTNGSAASCRLDGYPAAWFATSAGQRLGDAAASHRCGQLPGEGMPPGNRAHAAHPRARGNRRQSGPARVPSLCPGRARPRHSPRPAGAAGPGHSRHCVTRESGNYNQK